MDAENSRPIVAVPEKTLHDLGWPALLETLAARCHTERGSAAARGLVACDSADEARVRLADLAEACLLHELDLPPPFGGITDVELLLARAEKGGALEGEALLAVGQTLAACTRLRRHLVARATEAPRLAALAATTAELSHVSGPILESLDDKGQLLDHASPALGTLRRRLAALHDALARAARGLLEDAAVTPHLQDRFFTQRHDRYVVPVRSDARARVPGIVHGTSQSGQTVFIEPEAIVDLNNRLELGRSDVLEEELRILAELTGYVREEATGARTALAVATRLDLLDGSALFARALDASAPTLDDTGVLALKRARHPHLVLAGRDCVANDLLLGPGESLVISGPNAGGKTVALKTAGLLALMARAGLFLPVAHGSRIPFYRSVLSDIGDDQSLERNLSTFSAHLQNLRSFLDEASGAALILVDEIAAGTEPDQGAALAEAVLVALAARGAQVIATTHYERLKALPARDRRFVNASVGFDLARMAPTFELELGVPGSSGALFLARRLGLPAEVVTHAEALTGHGPAGIEELLIALTEERRRIAVERRELAEARRTVDAALGDAERARRDTDAERRRLRAGAHDGALAELARARDELGRLRKSLRRAASGSDDNADAVTTARAELLVVAGRIAEHAPAAAPMPGRLAELAELTAGTTVLVASLGARGQVVSPPERGRVTVQVGALRTAVALADVRIVAGAKGGAPPTPPRRATASTAPVAAPAPAPAPAPATTPATTPATAREDLAPTRTPELTLDVRGERVDDALARLDRFLDDALLGSREAVFVIHGHGTGALRDAVRRHADGHLGVSRLRPGAPRDGGDGVTVIWLDS